MRSASAKSASHWACGEAADWSPTAVCEPNERTDNKPWAQGSNECSNRATMAHLLLVGLRHCSLLTALLVQLASLPEENRLRVKLSGHEVAQALVAARDAQECRHPPGRLELLPRRGDQLLEASGQPQRVAQRAKRP